MPGRDGTGPMGTGRPMGGRGLGNCANRGAATDVQVAPGQNFGRGLGQGGGGRGRGRMLQAGGSFGVNAPYQGSDVTRENQELMRQNEALRSEMETIMKRLDAMETRTADSK